MRFNMLILISLSMQVIAGDIESLRSLESVRWDRRIIIVYSDDLQRSNEVLRQLQYFKNEIDDRDILWFINTDKQFLSNASDYLDSKLINNLQQFDDRKEGTDFSAVLIGKDGGIKKRQREWDIDKLFALIDTMPMRQREMQEK